MISKDTLVGRAIEINSLMNVNFIYTRRTLGKLLSNKNVFYDDPTFSKILLIARQNNIIRFDTQQKIIRYWKKEI